MRISACIIAKNESKNISTCIESCKRLTDDVIVVDTGSEDDTIKIAQRAGATTYSYAWKDDFADAKNFALSKAAGGWIFFPDADEYIDQDTADIFIKEMKRYLDDKNIDALTAILYNIDNKSGEIKKGSTVTRVFKRDRKIYYRGKIHEKLVHEDRKLIHIILDKAKIYHTGYSAEILPQKHERNLRMLLQAEKNNEVDGSNYYHIAGTLYALNRHEEALNYIEKLENHRDYDFLVKNFSLMPNFFIFKVLIMMKLEEKGENYSFQDMIEVIGQAERHYPDNYEIAEQKINVLLYWHRYDEALSSYDEILRIFDNAQKRTDFSHKKDRSRMLCGMARLYAIKGDTEKSFDYYREAVLEDFTFEMAIIGLLDLIKNQPADDIISFLNRIYDENVDEQVGFLTFVSAKVVLPAVFFYYFDKLMAEDSDRYRRYVIYKNIFCENYDDAIKAAVELKKSETRADKIKELDILHHVAEVLGGKTPVQDIKNEKDRDTYIGSLEMLLRLGKIDEAEVFLDAVSNDDDKMILRIADLFKNIDFFDAALDFYGMLTGDEDKDVDPKLQIQAIEGLAYCKYRKGDFVKAKELYEKIASGSKSANQYLKWIGEFS